MELRHKQYVSWLPNINIVYNGYQILILCISEPRHKYCASWITNISWVLGANIVEPR